MTQAPNTHEDPVEPRHIGFFERRWNMMKAFAKKTYEHLFSVKTWVSSAVLFGGMAFLSTGAAGEIAKTAASFFVVQPTVPGVLTAMGKALAIGTVMHAGIGMYKEAKRCDDCEALATQVENMGAAQGAGRAPAQAQAYAHYVPEQYAPGYTPPIDTPQAERTL